MSKAGLMVNNWLVLEETKAELRLVSRGTGVRRTIKKSLTDANQLRTSIGLWALYQSSQLQYSTSGPERKEGRL